jgi:cysteine synthase A
MTRADLLAGPTATAATSTPFSFTQPLLRHPGVDVRLTSCFLVGDAATSAKEPYQKIPGAFLVDQFNNPANITVHRRTTAEETWSDTGGNLDVFVAAVGTAGTLMGVASVLKERRPDIRIIAVEPAALRLALWRKRRTAPDTWNCCGLCSGPVWQKLVDEIVPVSNEDAFATTRLLALHEGISSGISAGAAIYLSLTGMKRPEMVGKTAATILPDTGDRYARWGLFNDNSNTIHEEIEKLLRRWEWKFFKTRLARSA